MIINKECKGCIWARECSIKNYAVHYECPCLTCLIKMVCSDWQTCEEWAVFSKDMWKKIEKELTNGQP